MLRRVHQERSVPTSDHQDQQSSDETYHWCQILPQNPDICEWLLPKKYPKDTRWRCSTPCDRALFLLVLARAKMIISVLIFHEKIRLQMQNKIVCESFWHYRWMEFFPWLNVWWEFEVEEVDDNIVWKMVVLLVIWSNWIILVKHFRRKLNCKLFYNL